jgi:glycosyltransferase involved in cell wall biosynthesis
MSSVTVVIPCFNAGAFIDEAVQSALAQTWADLEVVVVDDGSTDPATRRVLDAATWPRTRVLHQANAGPSAARNAAIREARGEFILPLDADDRIDPTYVEKAMAAFAADPGLGIVYCRATRFGADEGLWKLPDYAPRELVIDNVIFVSALFRKADWARVGGFGEHLRHGVEDYDFWVRMVGAGCRVHQIDEALFHYRVQAESRTSGFARDRAAMVSTYAAIFRGNIDFYANNAEVLFEHRFALYDELARYRARYGWLEAALGRHPRLARIAVALVRALRRVAGGGRT